MTTKQRRPLPPPAPVDNRTAVQKMIAADHARGDHDKLPLGRCPECKTIPTELIGRVVAKTGAPMLHGLDLALGEDMTVVAKIKDDKVVGYVSPKRSRKAAVPPVVEQPLDTPVVVTLPSGRNILTHTPEAFAPTREEWLLRAVKKLEPRFLDHIDGEFPVVRVSVGWPGGRGTRQNTIGQCWSKSAVHDGVAAIFISPVLLDPVEVLSTLVHELAHACLVNAGHRGRFVKLAKAVGLVGPWTGTSAGPELKEELKLLADKLGPFNHGQIGKGISPMGKPKVQSTRMLKLQCPEHGYTVRTTRQWINVGLPYCPILDKPGAGADERGLHQLEEVTK